MDYAKIEQHREGLNQTLGAYELLAKAAKSLAEDWKKVNAAEAKVQAEAQKIADRAQKLATAIDKHKMDDVPAFALFRKALTVAESEIPRTKPPATDAIAAAMSKKHKDTDDEFEAWVLNLTERVRNWTLKKGMVFFEPKSGKLYELARDGGSEVEVIIHLPNGQSAKQRMPASALQAINGLTYVKGT